MLMAARLLLVAVTCGIWCSTALTEECSNLNPCQLKGGEPFLRCEEYSSKDGYLNIVLNVEVAIFKFEWLELPRRSYNGKQCTPTWRVKPGDKVNVLLVNKLSAEDPEGDHNGFGKPNTTNLHTHGLHISSKKPQDNVFVEVKPGESFTYMYEIADDHPSGTFWYHAHVHGSTTLQTAGGLAGMLIVEDDPAKMPQELDEVSCPNNCEHDLRLVISPLLIMKSYMAGQDAINDNLRYYNNVTTASGENIKDWLKKSFKYHTVNGQFRPIISINAGQVTRFRMVHAGNDLTLELMVVDEGGNTAPCEIREIAFDGIYLDNPRTPRLEQSVISPGNRLDWLIRCDSPGIYKLVSDPKEVHKISFARTPRIKAHIATLNVAHGKSGKGRGKFPPTLPKRPHYVGDLRNVVPDKTIVVEIGGFNTLNREKWTGPKYYRYKVEVGSVVDIQLVSADYDFSHPMHIHVNHFQVMGYEKYVGPAAYYKFNNPIWEMRDLEKGEVCDYQHKEFKGGELPFNVTDVLKFAGHDERAKASGEDSLPYVQSGDWRDTITSLSLSNITLRSKIEKFTGPVLIHCHMPADSDLGMMMVIEIVEKGADTTNARMDSKGAHPGSCKLCDWNLHKEVPDECKSELTFPKRYALYLLLVSTLILAAGAVAKM